MKKQLIILSCLLVALISCTKSKEVHPELGDGNDEFLTVGINDARVEYTRTDHSEIGRVVFHYCPADATGNAQQFVASEMTKKETYFELALNNLLSDTLYWYYYELFPNGGEPSNTVQKTFHTEESITPVPPTPPTPPSGVPEGAINGLFTINANGDKVYFSQGNLQYQASTNTWRFAEHQWNLVGGHFYEGEIGNVFENGVKCDNMLVSASYSGWIDLFCWGTSGWDCGNVYYHPYDKDGEGEQYGPLGYSSLTGENANSDWGVFNSIINGGNQSGLWRTLTLSEWYYVISYRNQASEKLSMAQVNGAHGCVILPDDWECPSGLSFVPQSFDWTTNVYTEQQWMQMELKGAVFLPAGGERNSIGLLNYDRCEYHTANASSDWSCWHFIIDISGFVGDTGYSRVLAPSVRLVQDANP